MVKDIIFTPPSRRNLDEIVASTGVTEAMESNARAGLSYAESIAPVLTGDYVGSFRVEVEDGAVVLINDDPGAAAIEFGREGGEGHFTLNQTADFIEGAGD